MSHRLATLRAFFARLINRFQGRAVYAAPTDSPEFYKTCRELAFWTASDAGLDGQIDAFDGSVLHPAADGMCTIRMVLRDSVAARPAHEAAAAVLRSLRGLRVLLLLEIDGYRFTSFAPNVNIGVRELARSFADRFDRTS